MRINVLDKFTAELIAAGEVVEKPASVVKELCENAIDAGAKNISIEIECGGISLIRIQDDGSGIVREDIPKAFLRHATSKLKSKDDLDAIHTLGFRGEALPSIASVSRLDLLSKTANDEYASLYVIEGGVEVSFDAAPGPGGTTISVHDLFYNTPARMKFLKKDVSEGNYVSEVVTRLALSHPEISFTFIRDSKTAFYTPGDGKLESAVYSCIGAEFAKGLLTVEGGNGNYSVKGLITNAKSVRASRSMQFFFINGRYVKNRTMLAALEQAYRGRIMTGKFPGCVLFLQMPAELVDVNVHPAKTEVRFASEGDVFDAVYRAVKGSLVESDKQYPGFSLDKKPVTENIKNDDTQEISTQTTISDIGQDTGAVNNYRSNNRNYEIKESYAPVRDTSRINTYNDMLDTLQSSSESLPYRTNSGLDIMYEEADEAAAAFKSTVINTGSIENTKDKMAEHFTAEASEGFELEYVGEVFKTYILATNSDKLYFIDKHAAHERILYEKLVAESAAPGTQQLLTPETVSLSAEEKNALLLNKGTIENIGFEIDDFGEGTIIIRGVPADVQNLDITNLIIEIAEKLSVNSKDSVDEKKQWVFHSIACRAALKAGDKSDSKSLIYLAKNILEEKVPPYCPHGRPVVIEITRKELEKQFGRLG